MIKSSQIQPGINFFQIDNMSFRERLPVTFGGIDYPVHVVLGDYEIVVTNSGHLTMPDGMTPAEALLLAAITITARRVNPDPDCFATQTVQKWAPHMLVKDTE